MPEGKIERWLREHVIEIFPAAQSAATDAVLHIDPKLGLAASVIGAAVGVAVHTIAGHADGAGETAPRSALYGCTVPLTGIGSGFMAVTAPFVRDGLYRRVDRDREKVWPQWFVTAEQAAAFLRARGATEPETMSATNTARLGAWMKARACVSREERIIEGVPVGKVHAADTGNGVFLWRLALTRSGVGFEALSDREWSFTEAPFVFASEAAVRKALDRLGVAEGTIETYLPQELERELVVKDPHAFGPNRYRRVLAPPAVGFESGPSFAVLATGEPDPGGDVRLAHINGFFVPWTLENPGSGRLLYGVMNGRRIVPAFTTEERAFLSLGSAGFTVQTYPSHLAREREVAAILDRLPEKGRVPPSSPAGMAP